MVFATPEIELDDEPELKPKLDALDDETPELSCMGFVTMGEPVLTSSGLLATLSVKISGSAM